jgi:hypothetical protein
MCTLQQSADQLLSKLTILGGHVEEEPQFQVEKDVKISFLANNTLTTFT